jgi:hypothetical protein
MGAMVLVDRSTGRAMGVSLWGSPETREATDAAMRPIRDAASEAMQGDAPKVALYEVPVYDLKQAEG